MGEQQGFAAHAGSHEGGLGTSMSTTYYYNIIFIKYLHNIFGAVASLQ